MFKFLFETAKCNGVFPNYKYIKSINITESLAFGLALYFNNSRVLS
jgi:hypothetical protein